MSDLMKRSFFAIKSVNKAIEQNLIKEDSDPEVCDNNIKGGLLVAVNLIMENLEKEVNSCKINQ